MTHASKLAIKVALSVTLTMVLPLAFGWDKPYWAAVAVLVMATTESYSHGVIKGRYRLAGTILGVALAFILLAFLSQQRELFLLSIVLLSGACAFGSRNPNHGYVYKMTFMVCAVICFTGGLQSSGSFNMAVLRLEETLLGITCYSLVFSLLWPDPVSPTPLQPLPAEPLDQRLQYTLRVVVNMTACLLIWIWLPIPGGFTFPMLAASLSMILAEFPSSAIRKLLLVVFIWALIILLQFALLMPNLSEAWQLAAFYFINFFLIWRLFYRPDQLLLRMLGSQLLVLLTNGAGQLIPSYNMITPLTMLLYMCVALAIIYSCLRLIEPQPLTA